MHDFLIGNNQIDKHLKYLSKYGGGELYWGLGIENEIYLEFEKKVAITDKFFLNKIPFIGMYNVNPIFIISSVYSRNNYKLELIMTESYKNIFYKNIAI
jgi:hypothetical protein